jgi:hypothetical protein
MRPPTLKSTLQGLRTVIVVTLVACLLWLYAENENVRSHPLDLDIQFVAPPDRPLVIKPAQPVRVRAIIRAAAGKFAEVERRTRAGPVPIVVRNDPDGKPLQLLALRDLLAGNPAMSGLGVAITEVQPTTMEVSVEPYQTVTLGVVVVADGVQLAGPATVDQKQVAVDVPASLAGELNGATAIARLDPHTLAQLEVNVPHQVEVPLELPEPLGDSPYVPSVSRVKVTLTIRKQTDTFTVPYAVPVLLQGPPMELANYSVVFSEESRFLRDVALTGPSDLIDRIRQGEVKVVAYVPLTADQLERAAGKEAVTSVPIISLPAGVTPVGSPPLVSYKIIKRG